MKIFFQLFKILVAFVLPGQGVVSQTLYLQYVGPSRVGHALLYLVFSLICSQFSLAQNVGTEIERNALFDTLVNRTLRWEAWSPYKNRKNSNDYKTDVEPLRLEFQQAQTQLDLLVALQKMSNLRHDRHLSVRENFSNVSSQRTSAPIKFWPDFSKEMPSVFVVDTSTNFSVYSSQKVQLGDVLVAVNEEPVESYYHRVVPFLRFSTYNGSLWEFAESISEKRSVFDPSLYEGTTVSYQFRSSDDQEYQVVLPFNTIDHDFTNSGSRSLEGYQFLTSNIDMEMFVKYLSDNVIVLLLWKDFEDVENSVNQVMAYARQNNLLNSNVILDISESSGGSGAPDLIRVLAKEPFQTTLGNVKIGDYLDDFRQQFSGSVRSWLDSDVEIARQNGAEYSPNVPFKLQYFSKDQPGIMQPATERFTGEVVLITGSNAGSQVDQCAAMLIDNNIPINSLGMPCGGYSNTWEYEPYMVFPAESSEGFEYHWNIGHTIRPNGEVLEGNPALPSDPTPLTSGNFSSYYDDLIAEAEGYLDKHKLDCTRGINVDIERRNDGSIAVTVVPGARDYRWYEDEKLLPEENKRFLTKAPEDLSTYRVEFFVGECPFVTEPYLFELVLSSKPSEKYLTLFPNPTSDFLIIDGVANIYNATIFNINGKASRNLIVQNLPNKAIIDLDGVKPGLHLIKLQTDKKMISTYKIIVK